MNEQGLIDVRLSDYKSYSDKRWQGNNDELRLISKGIRTKESIAKDAKFMKEAKFHKPRI